MPENRQWSLSFFRSSKLKASVLVSQYIYTESPTDVRFRTKNKTICKNQKGTLRLALVCLGTLDQPWDIEPKIDVCTHWCWQPIGSCLTMQSVCLLFSTLYLSVWWAEDLQPGYKWPSYCHVVRHKHPRALLHLWSHVTPFLLWLCD